MVSCAKKLPTKKPEIAFRMLISLTLKDPVNMESVVFCDPKNIMRGGVVLLIAPLQV